MARANSLKKAVQNVIDMTEKGTHHEEIKIITLSVSVSSLSLSLSVVDTQQEVITDLTPPQIICQPSPSARASEETEHFL